MIPLYLRRRLINRFNMLASLATMAVGLGVLGWILVTLLQKGLAGITWPTFSQMTPPPGSPGGLLNAIAGSVMMTLGAVAIGTPVGILAGTYLAEFGQRGWLAPVTRFINDILLSAPSIVIGLFVYELMVVRMKHFPAGPALRHWR